MSDPTTKPAQIKAPTLFDDLMDLIESVFFSVFLVLLVFTFLCRIATVEGESMLPTLQPGDRLVISSLAYTPTAEDVVIVDCKNSYTFDEQEQVVEGRGLGKRLVKRVIATEGQTIDINFETGLVTVDGETLNESFLTAPTNLNEGAFTYPLTVPEGYVFVMGDNRNNSRDSRDPAVGLVDTDTILGRVLFRAFPLSGFGRLNS